MTATKGLGPVQAQWEEGLPGMGEGPVSGGHGDQEAEAVVETRGGRALGLSEAERVLVSSPQPTILLTAPVCAHLLALPGLCASPPLSWAPPDTGRHWLALKHLPKSHKNHFPLPHTPSQRQVPWTRRSHLTPDGSSGNGQGTLTSVGYI